MIARPNESDDVIMARALQIMQATLQRRDEQIAKLQPRYADYARQGLAKNRNFEYHTPDGELKTTSRPTSIRENLDIEVSQNHSITIIYNSYEPSVDQEAIVQGYKLAFPANKEKLEEWLMGEDEYKEW